MWQAFNVSQMNFKKLALEGNISIRLIIVVCIIVLGLHAIQIILLGEKLFLEAAAMNIIISICLPIMIITILYLPKVSNCSTA